MTLGECIAVKRIENGYTQTELAKVLKTSQAFISSIERDQITPGVRTLVKLSKVLNVDYEYFMEHRFK